MLKNLSLNSKHSICSSKKKNARKEALPPWEKAWGRDTVFSLEKSLLTHNDLFWIPKRKCANFPTTNKRNCQELKKQVSQFLSKRYLYFNYYVKRFLLLSLWIKSLSVTIQMKATEQYFPVVLFIMPYKVVLTSESVDKIVKCDHSNESY